MRINFGWSILGDNMVALGEHLCHNDTTARSSGASDGWLRLDPVGFFDGSPVSGAIGPLGNFAGTKSEPIPIKSPNWHWAVPPNIRVPEHERKWYSGRHKNFDIGNAPLVALRQFLQK